MERDILHSRQKISDGLSFFEKDDGKVIVLNHNSLQSYVISREVYLILTSLDGETTVEEISDRFQPNKKNDIIGLISKFQKMGLCMEAEENESSNKISFVSRILAMKRIVISYHPERIPLFRSQNKVLLLLRYVLFASPLIFICEIPLIIHCLKSFEFLFRFSYLIACLILFLISLFIHEIAHGIFAISYGANVGEIGLQFEKSLYFIKFYVVICGFSYIKSTRQKVSTHLGGILSSFFLLNFSILFLQVKNIYLNHIGILIIIVNSICALVDIIPWNDSDGAKVVQTLAYNNSDR